MTDTPASETTYRHRLDERLERLANRPGATIRRVVRGSRGAFPTLVHERLTALGLAESLPDGEPARVEPPDTIGKPELHPLDFEWYFTDDTVRSLVRTLGDAGDRVLCLGTPTVAVGLARAGVPVTLVDRNPLFRMRLDDVPEPLTFVNQDLTEPIDAETAFPVVFLDPPWYPEHTHSWLASACRHVAADGRIYVATFPPLVRPAAATQRSELFDTIRHVGSLSVDDDALVYYTPPFERAVLEHSDVPVISDWRRGDLVRIDVRDPSALPDPPRVETGSDWETFVTNGRVVKLRTTVSGAASEPLAPIDGCEDYVLPSVSRRDARRNHVDLWTSRNRVAAVGNRSVVAEALELLEDGGSVSELRPAAFSVSIDEPTLERLATRLEAVLA
ncbi:hypothetical protein [Halopiger djelfimassiliensis]|uniref:hypothetical protein n=1 Tax=Halopiger djelfimassiliensis TaxID=1293047 RepID=UPI0006779ABF|nr:hypothetical protein [Halopiger djelfimassiliensis]